MATGDLIKLGTLYIDGVKQRRPLRPWGGSINATLDDQTGYSDVPQYYSSKPLEIRDTDNADAYKIYWREMSFGPFTYYVADRNIARTVSWDILNDQGLIAGKQVIIDGRKYVLSSISQTIWYKGIYNEDNIAQLPTHSYNDLYGNLTNAQLTGTHNRYWNWWGMYSVLDAYDDTQTCLAGYDAAGRSSYLALKNAISAVQGFRPVLRLVNTAPTISDSSRYLGDKNGDFNIPYYVDDVDTSDALSVTEYLDGVAIKTFAPIRRHTYNLAVPVTTLALGTHTASVKVMDGVYTVTCTWTFARTNSAPTITGADSDMGDKNTGFALEYSVDDADGDEVTVTEKLNDTVLRAINNVPKGVPQTLEVASAALYDLPLDSSNTLTITASDGKGGTAYRVYTFRRTNAAPAITGQDRDIGLQVGGFAEDYTVTDVEGDGVAITEYLDNQPLRSYGAALGEPEQIAVTLDQWLMLTNGTHQLRVEAVDSNAATSVRAWTFAKAETVIDLHPFPAPCATDERARKILFSPTWQTEGCTFEVLACNNAFDAAPAWEDITAQVLMGRVYNFINDTKTAEGWGVDIRVVMRKNEGYEGTVSISNYGGAFE